MPALTQQDLRIFASQRLTDTDDGGGKMTTHALTGADNELFNPVSNLDRAMGGFDARLVYPAVLADETLLGSHTIVSAPPAASNTAVLLVKGDYYGQERASIMERIESYRAATVESRMSLLGKQRKGAKQIQTYQATTAVAPSVGDVFALRRLANGKEAFEFVRVTAVTTENRTTEDNKGEFVRTVVTMTISEALENDYQGAEEVQRTKFKSDTQIQNTQIVDSASYFGIKPLAAAIAKGSGSLKVKSIYEQLVPVSTVENILADDWAAGRELYLPLANEQDFSVYGMFSGSLNLKSGVLPGSVKISGWTDNAIGQLVSGSNTLSIDYANGIISGLSNTWIGSLSAIPAIQTREYAYSSQIEINDTNVGKQWAPVLKPVPANGSVVVSYRSGKNWYDLTDAGDRTLRDDNGNVCGTISAQGTVSVELPAMPDSGSNLVVSWATSDYFKTFTDGDIGSVIEPQTLSTQFYLQADTNLQPNSVKLSWDGGSARDDGKGNLLGDCRGTIDYATGQIYPVGLSASKVQISAKQYLSAAKTSTVKAAVSTTSIGFVVGQLMPGSLKLSVFLERTTYSNYRLNTSSTRSDSSYTLIQGKNGHSHGLTRTVRKYSHAVNTATVPNTEDFAMVITDDGKGGLFHNGQRIQGEVNYATGEIQILMSSLKGAGILLEPQFTSGQIDPHTGYGGSSNAGGSYTFTRFISQESQITGASASATIITSSDVKDVSKTIETGLQTYELLGEKAMPHAVLYNTWILNVNGIPIREKDGIFYNGDKVVGQMNSVGKLTLNFGQNAVIKVLQGVYAAGNNLTDRFVGRTSIAPIKPLSLTIYNGNDTATADKDGRIQGERFSGSVNWETGFFHIQTSEPTIPANFRYSAVSQSTIPLDSSVIGINATRLPMDGKVPIYRVGDLIVIHDTVTQDLGSALTGGSEYELTRKDADKISVMDANGKPVVNTKYGVNDGKLTFKTPLDLSDYALPLTAHLTYEEENRVIGVDVSGSLKLQNALSRDYAQGYVSSAVISGDLLVRATEPFSQVAWTSVWQNTRIGNELLAKVNVNNYPIRLTAQGTITERWLLKFTSAEQFELYGENLGLIQKGDILSDLAPINPATNSPYFTLPRGAFGGGWAAQNCIRFNTTGTPTPIWVIRSIQPTSEKVSQKDGWTICLRGDTAI